MEDVSSCLGDPSLEQTQHIASDHRDMCRFSGLQDHEYQKISAAFGRIQNRITEISTNSELPSS